MRGGREGVEEERWSRGGEGGGRRLRREGGREVRMGLVVVVGLGLLGCDLFFAKLPGRVFSQ